MNRPTLPLAISSVPADQLPLANVDAERFSAQLDGLLSIFDWVVEFETRIPARSTHISTPTRTHVACSSLSSSRGHLLVTA